MLTPGFKRATTSYHRSSAILQFTPAEADRDRRLRRNVDQSIRRNLPGETPTIVEWMIVHANDFADHVRIARDSDAASSHN